MSTEAPTARQIAAQAAYDRAMTLNNPFETIDPESGCRTTTDRARWHAFESYRENVMDSLEGEFDGYTTAQLQECGAAAAEENHAEYE